MKEKAHKEGRAFLSYPVMGGTRGQDGGKAEPDTMSAKRDDSRSLA